MQNELKPNRNNKKSNQESSDGPKGLKIPGYAFQIGAELISALIVGVGIGLILDHFLNTKPIFLIIFFLLGSSAGILNVYRRVMNQMSQEDSENNEDK